MLGSTVGYAMDHMNVKYAELAGLLAYDLGELKYNPRYNARKTALHWIGTYDARSFAILGDPAARIPLASEEGMTEPRPEIMDVPTVGGKLPVVLVADSVEQHERRRFGAEVAGHTPIGGSPPQKSETKIIGDDSIGEEKAATEQSQEDDAI
jgi:hypothetical protein